MYIYIIIYMLHHDISIQIYCKFNPELALLAGLVKINLSTNSAVIPPVPHPASFIKSMEQAYVPGLVI